MPKLGSAPTAAEIEDNFCMLTTDEYDAITLNLAHIDALGEMGFPECGPPEVQTALLLMQERAKNINELLDVAHERTSSEKQGVAHG